MPFRRSALPVLLLSALVTVPGLAQAPAQTPPVPTHSVVRFFKCSPQSDGIRWLRRWEPMVRQMVAEGKFLDYGMLQHAWGDEWNVADYFTVSGLGGFFANFAELVRRVGDAPPPAPDGQPELRPLSEVCREHKDVIYGVLRPMNVVP